MNVNLNQIRKEYNDSISKIPEEKLKELYSSLYYEAYYTFFIERDDEAHKKAINALERLSSENEPWKRFRASKDAIVRVPIQILIELYNKNLNESRELSADLLTGYFIFVKTEIDFLNLLIDYINQSSKDKNTLEFIKEQMVSMRDGTINLLKIRPDLILKLIKYYENKENLSDEEKQGLNILKKLTRI